MNRVTLAIFLFVRQIKATYSSKVDAPRAFTYASYRNITSCVTSIKHRKKQIKELKYLAQELSCMYYYSICSVEYPLHPIACCLLHLPRSSDLEDFLCFSVRHLRCSSGHHSHQSLLVNKSVVVVLTMFS